MTQTVKQLFITMIAAFSLIFAVGMVPAVANAENIQGAIKCGAEVELDKTSGCKSDAPKSAGQSLNDLVSTIINVLSVIVGVVAVIMIIIGGRKYITSGGDSNNVASAKNTIIYAIIGLIIVALAQVIVRFVLSAL